MDVFGDVNVEVLLKDETVWLTQNKIGELFGKERSVITKHLNNIFTSGELDEKSNVQKMHFSHYYLILKRSRPGELELFE